MVESILRKLPDFKGKHRFANFLFRKYKENGKDILVKGKYECKYILPNIKESLAFDVFINGIYEPDISNFIASKIPENGLFLDLGANIGTITIPLSKRRKDIRTICVEAAPWIFEYLNKNIRQNNLESRVSCFNYAIFNEDNKRLPFFSPREQFGKGSLSPGMFTEVAVEVETICLDSLISRLGPDKINFIKIDIEGYEYYAFKGGEQLLRSEHAPDIIFEFVDWAESSTRSLRKGAAQLLLKEWGYNLYNFDKRIEGPITEIMTEGNSMIYATKKLLN